MSTCPSCNAPLQAGDRFCRQCGARIRKAPPASHEATNRPSPTRAKKAAAPLIVYVASAGHTQLLDVAERGARDHRAHPLVAKDARQVQELLRQLDASGERPEAVCLLGTNADLPHARFSDGTGTGIHVLTDNDYGMLDEPDEAARHSALALPDVPVCRVPVTHTATVERLLSVRDVLAADWTGGLAVSCATWERASADVLRQIVTKAAVELACVPPHGDNEVAERLGGSAGRMYFNVHGSDQDVLWVGEGMGGYPPALRPDGMRAAADAVLVSEACFGARHDEADGDTIATRFFQTGGSAFVGSTIIAWGPVAPPLDSADLIVTGTYAALDAGQALPAALLAAKARIVQNQGEPLSPVALNTVSSFVAYGGPLARVQGAGATTQAPPSGAGTWARTPVSHGGPGDVLGRVRRASGGPLNAARKRLADRARHMGYIPVSQQVLQASELPSRFARAADLQARLAAVLSGSTDQVHVLEYKTRLGPQTAVVARDTTGGYPQLWVVDRLGTVRVHLTAKTNARHDRSS